MAMTTSMTRSRRAEGHHLASSKTVNGHRLQANAKDPYAPRPKRQLDAADREFDPIVAKKARFTTGIAVEIPARSSFHARFAKDTADAKPAPRQPPKPAVAAPPNNAPTSHRAPPANRPKSAPARPQQQKEQPKQQPKKQKQQPALTKHQEKVANGLKHELDRLQPNAADTKDQGRKLRSQEATRFKSELSAYFPEYDEVIGNDPKEMHLLNFDTPIIIIPEPSPPNRSDSSSSHIAPHPLETTTATSTPTTYPVRSYSDALYTDLFDAQRIDFSWLKNRQQPQPHPSTTTSSTSLPFHPAADEDRDPLPDSLYTNPHKKAERLERSIRNTEKGRAQHEKDQIIRLLDGLQGPDWLRVMGVSGITESKKRVFEPAREHFIRGCEGILAKFRRWAAEEKRRRLELAERRAHANEEGDDGRSTSDGGEGEGGEREVGDSEDDEEDEGEEAEEEDGGDEEEGEPPDDSDVDASIAKQLREEALAAEAKKRNKSTIKGAAGKRGVATARGKAATAPSSRRPSREPAEKEEPPREITSFFAKRYQRDAALSRNRRRNRKVLAWGQPVPDLPEAEFELPTGLCDEETLKSHARKRRREKRVKK